MNLRLLKTVAGSIFDSFNKWKTIPETKADQDYKNASKFEVKITYRLNLIVTSKPLHN
jgi:hypothetical protein